MEFDRVLDTGELKEQVIAHMEENIDYYAMYHHIPQDQDEESQKRKEVELEQLYDVFRQDILRYFTTGNFQLDVVDLILRAVCKVLQVNMAIYTKQNDVCKVITQDHASRSARTLDLLYSGGHYDAIVKTQGDEEVKETKPNLEQLELNLDMDALRQEVKLEIKQEIKLEIKQEYEEEIRKSLKPIQVESNTPESAIPIEHDEEENEEDEVHFIKEVHNVHISKKSIFKNQEPITIGSDDNDTDDDNRYLPDIPTDNDESLSISEDEDASIPKGKKKPKTKSKFYFNLKSFKEEDMQRVPKVPYDMNGHVSYIIVRATAENYVKLQRDGWHFHMVTTSSKKHPSPNNVLKVGKCLGSFQCINVNCAFL